MYEELEFEKDRKSRIPGCPLHPSLNKGKDLREGYCEIEHLCKAAYMYNQSDEKQKKKFIQFLKNKNLSWYNYSIKMDNDELLKEFISST